MRLARVAIWGKASEHRARATWVNMLLCARWEAMDLFLSLRIFFNIGFVRPYIASDTKLTCDAGTEAID